VKSANASSTAEEVFLDLVPPFTISRDAALASDESAETESREIVKGGTKSKKTSSAVDEAFADFTGTDD
jgi:hypothetical protein